MCDLLSLLDTLPVQTPLQVSVKNPILSSHSRSETSNDILDMGHIKVQEQNSPDGEVRQNTLNSGQAGPETPVQDQQSMDNHVKSSLDVENENSSRLPCVTRIPDGA